MGNQQIRLIPLKNYWSAAYNDSWTLANNFTENDAKMKGYQYIHTEGYVFSSQAPGTVALNMYFAPSINDHCITTRNLPTIDSRYQFIRCEGYVYPTMTNGTIPVMRTYRPDRCDTQTSSKLQHVQANGYQVHAQAEFYVLPSAQLPNQFSQNLLSLKNYWSAAYNDSWTLANNYTENDAKMKGYQYIHTEGYIFPSQTPGTVPLNMYFAPSLNDHCATIRNLPTIDSRYQYIRCEGYVYPTSFPGTIPVMRTFRPDRFDTQTSSKLQHVQANGYQVHAQAEFYVLPNAQIPIQPATIPMPVPTIQPVPVPVPMPVPTFPQQSQFQQPPVYPTQQPTFPPQQTFPQQTQHFQNFSVSVSQTPTIGMNHNSFHTLIQNIKKESFSQGKKNVIQLAANMNMFTCQQLKQIMSCLSFSSDKIFAVQCIAPKIVDKQNSHVCLSGLTFSSDKQKVQQLLM